MNKPAKTALKILGVIVFIGAGWFTLSFIAPTVSLFRAYDKQMSAGRKYMDSLTEKDFQVWTDRTKKYLNEYDPKADIIGSKPVPPELKQLKILRIDEDTNWVSYVWAGGLDHTELYVERMTDGEFQFTARYNDESNRVIWPKAPHTNNSTTNLPFQLIQ